MRVLSHLKPASVLYYFEDICRIPHGSGNVAALVDYCVAFAEANGLEWERDEAQNLVIRKAASPGYENSDVLVNEAGYASLSVLTWNMLSGTPMPPLKGFVPGMEE